ncbi:hyaluronidase-like isoform X2 [Chelonus insularis]|uniref:hyaluronidase-like isoform X2 n=1 Tax=Chelonus insularis TaxID=460826 RepID=UPI00158D3532|nr:hyaluronidase-like isoform X2 [Chelonus insularis]
MNLYSEIIVIFLLIQFTTFKCRKLSIEPKIGKTYLNIPLSPCYKYGVYFNEFYETVMPIANFSRHNQSIEVATFYNSGLLDDRGPEEMGQLSYVYLQYNDISQEVDEHFRGLGILNYTTWNPIFRQNQGPLEYYYNHSILIQKNMYSLLNDEQTKELAKLRFEFASKTVFTETLVKVKNVWPQATWGVFDYPKCNSLFNEGNNQCDKDVMEDNDRLSWLWDFEIALFPSLSIPTYFNRETKRNYINARLNEAKRIADKYIPPLNIVPHLSLNYRNDPDRFLSFSFLL